MKYYIKYPKNQKEKVAIVSKRPDPRRQKKYGFAEGSFNSKKEVITRLNQMNIPVDRRPAGWKLLK